MKLITNCTCGVPDQAHGKSCGWNNAKLIVFEGDSDRNVAFKNEEQGVVLSISQPEYMNEYPLLASYNTTPKEQIMRWESISQFVNF